ncbi:MAG: ATP-binding cassette domain-containing protein [Chloroflexota bacterium]|nr:ATP-binding cassette domain-containing protein [Chloroflexota bacterium]
MNNLKLSDVDLGYREHPVVRGVSLEVTCGEVVGIVGPNGSGKSTILKALCGLLHPSSGYAAIDDDDMHRMSREALACRIGMVFQAPTLPDSFTVLEMVLMGRYPHLGMLRHESKRDLDIVFHAMERTGIVPFAARYVNEISGGERQRVIIARALAQEPRFLLLDEPTAHLDIQHQLEVMELVKSLAESGLGVAVALHDFSLASRFCHRLVMLKDGSVFKEGAPKDVMTTENIKHAFGVTAMIYSDLAFGPLVVNTAISRSGLDNSHRRIHIIGGGGSAAAIMHHLHNEGYRMSIGVLNQGDTDLSTARALGIEAVVISPFAAIDDAAHQRNLELAAQADCCLVSNVAFGWANLRNLEAASVSRRLMLVDDVPISERDFTDNQATDIYNAIKINAQCIDSGDISERLKNILLQEEVSNERS